MSGTPAVTYFVRERLGVGVQLGGGFSEGAGVSALRRPIERRAEHVLAGAHGVFDLPIAQRLSLFVWPAIAYVHEWIQDRPPVEPLFQQQAALSSAARTHELGYVRLALSLPLVFHLSRSVAVGLGPELWLDFVVRRVPAFDPNDDQAASANPFPAPARRRFQVGLSSVIVIAI